jgi:pimeloyl-ACP methyl ester carboxylesterase
MHESVYKSAEGQKIVENAYRQLLAATTATPFQQRFLETATAKTHVLHFGDSTKPPLLMLHGSMSNSATWLGVAPLFIDAFSVFCVDIPGEPGLSEPVRMDLASDKPVLWLASLLDQLAIAQASFLAMSLGSWYALNFAVNHPQRSVALSLITTGGIAPQRKDFIVKALFCMMLGQRGQQMLNNMVFHKTTVPPQVLAAQALVAKHFNPLTKALPLFTDAQLRQLTMPLQYFGGDRDALLDTVKTAARLRTLTPQAELHVLADTGHVIIDQFPTTRDFLLRVTG